jgi:hypothetical protein
MSVAQVLNVSGITPGGPPEEAQQILEVFAEL